MRPIGYFYALGTVNLARMAEQRHKKIRHIAKADSSQNLAAQNSLFLLLPFP